jgi:hypothetical protein
MSKVIVVTKVARQVEGEYVLVSILGAFRKQENVEPFLRLHKAKSAETIDGIDYVVELGVIQEVEILDEENQ